jgi:hypothetical protein
VKRVAEAHGEQGSDWERKESSMLRRGWFRIDCQAAPKQQNPDQPTANCRWQPQAKHLHQPPRATLRSTAWPCSCAIGGWSSLHISFYTHSIALAGTHAPTQQASHPPTLNTHPRLPGTPLFPLQSASPWATYWMLSATSVGRAKAAYQAASRGFRTPASPCGAPGAA